VRAQVVLPASPEPAAAGVDADDDDVALLGVAAAFGRTAAAPAVEAVASACMELSQAPLVTADTVAMVWTAGGAWTVAAEWGVAVDAIVLKAAVCAVVVVADVALVAVVVVVVAVAAVAAEDASGVCAENTAAAAAVAASTVVAVVVQLAVRSYQTTCGRTAFVFAALQHRALQEMENASAFVHRVATDTADAAAGAAVVVAAAAVLAAGSAARLGRNRTQVAPSARVRSGRSTD